MTYAWVLLGTYVVLILAVVAIILRVDQLARRRERRAREIIDRDREGCDYARRQGVARGQRDFADGLEMPKVPRLLVTPLDPDDGWDRVEAVLAARRMAAFTSGRYAGWCEAWQDSLAQDLDRLPQVA